MNIPGFTAEASLGRKTVSAPANVRTAAAAPPQVIPQVDFPRYGNYCGPGYGDDTGNTPPVDAVDAVCRTHDLCYNARGYSDCECDGDLIRTMPAAIAQTPSAEGKAAGAAGLAFFSVWPCYCRTRPCVTFFGRRFCSNVSLPGFGGNCI